MDLIIYCAVLFILGAMRINQTKDVSDNVGIVDMGDTSTVDCSLPIASNLSLQKDPMAYTIILKEFNLA